MLTNKIPAYIKIMSIIDTFGNGKLPIKTIKSFCTNYSKADINLSLVTLINSGKYVYTYEQNIGTIKTTLVECIKRID